MVPINNLSGRSNATNTFHINYIGIKRISLLRDNLAKGWIYGVYFIL